MLGRERVRALARLAPCSERVRVCRPCRSARHGVAQPAPGPALRSAGTSALAAESVTLSRRRPGPGAAAVVVVGVLGTRRLHRHGQRAVDVDLWDLDRLLGEASRHQVTYAEVGATRELSCPRATDTIVVQSSPVTETPPGLVQARQR